MCIPYSGTGLRWPLYKAATSLRQPASLVPNTININSMYCSHLSIQADCNWPTSGCLRQVSPYVASFISNII